MRRLLDSSQSTAVLLAALVFGGLCRADSGKPFESELARLAGRSARQCGLVGLHGDPKPGLACAVQADKDGMPFWYALEQRGEDSQVWIAAIRTPEGGHLVLHYDSNVSGGRGLKPHFEEIRCAGPIDYRPTAWPPIECRKP